MRWHTARKAAAECGIRARHIGPFPDGLAGGRVSAVAFGDKPTIGVIGYNDLMSIGLMRELTRQGASVPDDVRVIGFDDMDFARVLDPALTTVGVSVEVNHVGATPVGARVRARAQVDYVENRRLTFVVHVFDKAGEVAEGTHVRMIVDRERFLASAAKRHGR